MKRVTIYNEYIHEREYPGIAAVYPEGIHHCIGQFLEKAGCSVRYATFDMPQHGLTDEVLSDTDVLIFWSHCRQDEFSDEVALRVRDKVHGGMGLIALHSAHYSKVMKYLLGTPMTLSWKNDDSERLICSMPSHPIAAGVPGIIELPHEELYSEPFGIPNPDDTVFMGWFQGGGVFRSGVTFTRGNGKIFYFQPGHEEYPIYYNPSIQRIITNAVDWARPLQAFTQPQNIQLS